MPIFGKNRTLFKIFGFPIKLNPTWFLLFFLIVFSLSSRNGLFQEWLRGDDVAAITFWVLGVVGALGLFVSLIIHELCHSIVARHTGMPVKGITLFIFGGVSEMEDEPPTALSEFFMAVVGPLSSLAIAGLCGSVWVLGNFVFAFPSTVNVLFGYLAIVNCMLAIFNSLPAFPLDGGRVVRSILWGITGNLWSATRVASTIGSAFGMAMIVGGIFMLFNGVLIGGIWLVFIGFFLRQAASGSLNQIVMRRALGGERVGHFMTSGPTCVTPDMTLQKFVDDYVLPYHYNLFPVVDESKRLVGAIRALDPSTVDQEKWDSTRIEELMRRDIDGILIDPNTPAMDALKRLRDEQGRRLIVVEEGRPVGILSLRDLLDFLEIKMDLSGLPRH